MDEDPVTFSQGECVSKVFPEKKSRRRHSGVVVVAAPNSQTTKRSDTALYKPATANDKRHSLAAGLGLGALVPDSSVSRRRSALQRPKMSVKQVESLELFTNDVARSLAAGDDTVVKPKHDVLNSAGGRDSHFSKSKNSVLWSPAVDGQRMKLQTRLETWSSMVEQAVSTDMDARIANHQKLPMASTGDNPLLDEFANSGLARRWHEIKMRCKKQNAFSAGSPKVEGNVPAELNDLLRQLPMFKTCNMDLTQHLLKSSYFRTFQPAQIILAEGFPCSSLLVVIEGEAEFVVEGETVETLKVGHYIGETHLMGLEQTFHHTLISTSGTCFICEIERNDFLASADLFSEERMLFKKIMEQHSAARLMEPGTILNTCNVFKGLRHETIEALNEVVIRRLYFPEKYLFEEGQTGDELYLLVQGRAEIFIAGRTVRQERCERHMCASGDNELGTVWDTPLCFGEFGFLGMTKKRCASVVARTPSQVLILYRHVFLRCLQSNNDALSCDLGALLEQSGANASMQSKKLLKESAIFQQVGCSDAFFDFLHSHLEDRVHLKGQMILEDGVTKLCSLYILISGKVELARVGAPAIKLEGGAVFGENNVLGLCDHSRRMHSAKAKGTCWMQVLHQNVLVRGLELFPQERRKILVAAYKQNDQSVAEPYAMECSTNNAFGSHDMFLQVLRKSPLFEVVTPEFLRDLSEVAIDRISLPGDMILKEGQTGDSMFVMISGTAGVYVLDLERLEVSDHHEDNDYTKSSRVGTLGSGSLIGELAFLGVALTRSATIKADTICTMWEIKREAGFQILEKHPEAQKHFKHTISEHLERTVPSRVLMLPLFRSFDRKFRTLIGLHCERQVVFPGGIIVKDAALGDRLVIVNVGVVILKKHGVTLQTYTPGTHFGSSVMLGTHKSYFGNFIALQTCHILLVSRASYFHALDNYPSNRAAMHFKSVESSAETELRLGLDRNLSRTLMWKRYVEVVGDPNQMSDEEIISSIFVTWVKFTNQCSALRVKREREWEKNDASIRDWLGKKKTLANAKTLRQNADDVATVAPTADEGGEIKEQAHIEQLQHIVESWPAPKPSPYYDLRVWGVLTDAAEVPSMAKNLLPMLANQSPPSARSKSKGQSQESAGGAGDADWILPNAEATSPKLGAAVRAPRSPRAKSKKNPRLNPLAWPSATHSPEPSSHSRAHSPHACDSDRVRKADPATLRLSTRASPHRQGSRSAKASKATESGALQDLYFIPTPSRASSYADASHHPKLPGGPPRSHGQLIGPVVTAREVATSTTAMMPATWPSLLDALGNVKNI